MAIEWIGTTGDWSDAADWSDGLVPNSKIPAEIANGGTVTVSKNETVETLTLTSGATL